jgi:hypothetical protein
MHILGKSLYLQCGEWVIGEDEVENCFGRSRLNGGTIMVHRGQDPHG